MGLVCVLHKSAPSHSTLIVVDGHITLNEDYSKRWGLSSSLFVECSKCKKCTFFRSSVCDQEKNDSRQGNDINRRMAFAATETGLTKQGIETLCEILNMPGPPDDMDSHYEELLKSHRTVLDRMCFESRAKLRQFLLEEKGLSIDDAKTILDATVCFDGTWSKCGFMAKNGIGFVISPDTGEVLDYCIRSKYCNKCKYSEKANCTDCRKNYTGSSPGMERDCAKELWENSKHNGANLRYTGMVTDGDSKAFSDIWDV